MTGPNLARLGGLAAAFGGVLSALINTLNFVIILSMGRPLQGIAYGGLRPLLDLRGIFIATCFAVGLTGLCASGYCWEAYRGLTLLTKRGGRAKRARELISLPQPFWCRIARTVKPPSHHEQPIRS